MTDQRIERLFLAGLDFRDNGGTRGEHVVDDSLDGGLVGNLPQPFTLDDPVGITFTGPHRVEDVFGDLARNRVVLDARQQPGQRARRHRRSTDIDLVAIERRGQRAHDPARRQFRRATRRPDSVLEITGNFAARRQRGRLIPADIVLGNEAHLHCIG